MPDGALRSPRGWLPWALTAVLPLASGAAGAVLTYRAAGPTLGLYLGGLAVVALLAPGIALLPEYRGRRWAAVGSLVLGIAVVWLWGGRAADVNLREWAACFAVLAAWAAALGGLAMGLERIARCPAPAAAGTVVLLALLWLTWPIWLAPWLPRGKAAEPAVAALVIAHPVFATDGVLRRPLPTPWAQHRYAYRWTTLGDDILYERPTSVLPAVGLHAILACAGIVRLRRRHN